MIMNETARTIRLSMTRTFFSLLSQINQPASLVGAVKVTSATTPVPICFPSESKMRIPATVFAAREE